MLKTILKPMALGAAMIAGAPAALAQSEAAGTLAKRGIESRMIELSADPDRHAFELGMLSALRAVEKTLQTRHQYGLGDRITGLPLLRLNARGMRNIAPEPAAPDTVSRLVDGFVQDMAETQVILAAAKRIGIQPFDLVLQDLWFDVDKNGNRDKGEDAMDILAPVLLDNRTRRDLKKSGGMDSPIRVRFDAADHAWLSAYSYMLSGAGNLFLAFDPAPVIAGLEQGREALKQAPQIPNFYDQNAVRAEIAALEQETQLLTLRQKELNALQKPANDRMRELQREMRLPENKDRREELQAKIEVLRELNEPYQTESRDLSRKLRFLRNETRAAEGKLAQTEIEVAPVVDIGPIFKMHEALQVENRALKARQSEIVKQIGELEVLQRQATSQSAKDAVQAQIAHAREAEERVAGEIRANTKKAEAVARAMIQAQSNDLTSFNRRDRMTTVRPAVDLVYIVLKALEQRPDPARVKAAHDNMLQMIAFNRVFWREVALETDNEAEWIPNPGQISALGIAVNADMARAWQNILADAEAVLEGRLLLPHPLLPEGYGIDLAAYVRDPGPIDLIAWIQGIGVYPYAARGPRITAQNWQAFSRLTQGRAGTFSLFFN